MKQKKIIKNYSDALSFLGRRDAKKYAPYTIVEVENRRIMGWQPIQVKYHGNVIVTFYQNGSAKFSSCNWMTQATKERINWFLPDFYRLYQDKGHWYLAYVPSWDWNKAIVYRWQDDIKITKDNSVLGPYEIQIVGKE